MPLPHLNICSSTGRLARSGLSAQIVVGENSHSPWEMYKKRCDHSLLQVGDGHAKRHDEQELQPDEQ